MLNESIMVTDNNTTKENILIRLISGSWSLKICHISHSEALQGILFEYVRLADKYLVNEDYKIPQWPHLNS